mmetsp:Transcript_1125/g.1768  ORF Transcript_1125/g.1768 Transcript_1125/m.1768 type:complete len:106 (-) Transcript_1125:799-1116(-)
MVGSAVIVEENGDVVFLVGMELGILEGEFVKPLGSGMVGSVVMIDGNGDAAFLVGKSLGVLEGVLVKGNAPVGCAEVESDNDGRTEGAPLGEFEGGSVSDSGWVG